MTLLRGAYAAITPTRSAQDCSWCAGRRAAPLLRSLASPARAHCTTCEPWGCAEDADRSVRVVVVEKCAMHLACVSGSYWGGRAVVVRKGGAAAGAWWAEGQGRAADHGGAGQRQRMAAVLDDDACRSGAG